MERELSRARNAIYSVPNLDPRFLPRSSYKSDYFPSLERVAEVRVPEPRCRDKRHLDHAPHTDTVTTTSARARARARPRWPAAYDRVPASTPVSAAATAAATLDAPASAAGVPAAARCRRSHHHHYHDKRPRPRREFRCGTRALAQPPTTDRASARGSKDGSSEVVPART